MMTSNTIPLDNAHEILELFGITEASSKYKNYVNSDGFEPHDFCEILNESEFIYWFNSDAIISDYLEYLQDILSEFDIEMEFSSPNGYEKSSAILCINNKETTVRYSPNSTDNFIRDVIEHILSVLPSHLDIRQWHNNEGAETFGVAILTKEEWESAENHAPDFFESYWVNIN